MSLPPLRFWVSCKAILMACWRLGGKRFYVSNTGQCTADRQASSPKPCHPIRSLTNFHLDFPVLEAITIIFTKHDSADLLWKPTSTLSLPLLCLQRNHYAGNSGRYDRLLFPTIGDIVPDATRFGFSSILRSSVKGDSWENFCTLSRKKKKDKASWIPTDPNKVIIWLAGEGQCFARQKWVLSFAPNWKQTI